ncbi:tetratricopeptide repeat-containing sulfotransferase family protein [Phenylobacterium sp.]|uniref:tetratricopeptide repeat-containing sulfotransferase family protein n=1 Tax=Phenylobacterium sp. TaxID=1871053 RepID=UPI002F3FD66F
MAEFRSGPIKLSLGARPRDAQADREQLRAVHEALRGGDIVAAADMAEAALARGLEHPMLFNLAAGRLEREDRFEEALVLLLRGHDLAPDDVGLRQALGLNLHRLERYAEALAHFGVVVAAHPDVAAGHAARGASLEALGDIQGAGTAYNRAVDLQPQNLAALCGLASLASRRGRHAEARALAERVVQGQPDYPDAVMILAQADLSEGRPGEGEARLHRLIADERANAVQQALAQGLLGDILDAQDKVIEAFKAYSTCNAGLAKAYAPRFGASPTTLSYARETLAVVQRTPAAAWSAKGGSPGADAAGHVFLMGFPRSGTTLLEQVLASHPDVEALEERDTLADATAIYGRPETLPDLATAGVTELARLREAYWRRVEREGAHPAGKVFVDKHPLKTLRLPLIAKLFPDAKVLFARRDPRDVVLSSFRRRFGMNAAMYQLLTLEGAAGFYDAAMQMGERLGRDFALASLVVRHESLVEDFESVAREICAFLGLSFTDAMRDFSDRIDERGVATPSAAQLARGLNPEGIGAWRRYAEPMRSVLPTLQPWVERFAYPNA